MNVVKLVRSPYTGIAMNFLYAIGNSALGFYTHSWWFITVGAYYIVLTVNRYAVLHIMRKANGNYEAEVFSRRDTGILLVVLSMCIVGVNILAAVEERGTAHHEIIMIAIATYTFVKITMAIIGMVKAGKSPSPAVKTLRNIALADAFVSIYTMQRSMLQSFPGMNEAEILLMNILTGTGVWIIVLLLGINLMGGPSIERAKTITAEAIAGCCKAIKAGILYGGKAVVRATVKGYRWSKHQFAKLFPEKNGESEETGQKK